MSGDRLFQHVETLNAGTPWGHVLDAGTGAHSLRWIASLPTDRWTAVTASATMDAEVRNDLGERFRPEDRVVVGKWSEAAFLQGERFDTVIADYLVGAIDGFEPYFQYALFDRLRPHVGGRLYVIGMEPPPDRADGPGQEAILDVVRTRDACILLAGDRCYREYPMWWVVEQLRRSGFVIDDARHFPILYRERFIERQLAVALRKLPKFKDPQLALAMEKAIVDLRSRALLLAMQGPIQLGFDWVVAARPG